MPKIRLRVRAKDFASVADKGRDVDECVRGSIDWGIEMRGASHNRAWHNIDLQFGRKITVFLHIVVGS
jgi:hypothetical protein